MGPSADRDKADPPPRPDDLERIVRNGTEMLLLRVAGAYTSAGEGWAVRLRAVAWAMRDFLVEDPARAEAMMLSAPHGNRATRKIREGGIAALTALIDQGRQEMAEPGVLPVSVAEITAGAIYNRIHCAMEAGGTAALGEDTVRELMFTAVLPYRGVEAALAELSMPPPTRS
jgi:hypothetical protein